MNGYPRECRTGTPDLGDRETPQHGRCKPSFYLRGQGFLATGDGFAPSSAIFRNALPIELHRADLNRYLSCILALFN